jgi:hypothetical protein
MLKSEFKKDPKQVLRTSLTSVVEQSAVRRAAVETYTTT